VRLLVLQRDSVLDTRDFLQTPFHSLEFKFKEILKQTICLSENNQEQKQVQKLMNNFLERIKNYEHNVFRFMRWTG
jgi:hypothetical protein